MRFFNISLLFDRFTYVAFIICFNKIFFYSRERMEPTRESDQQHRGEQDQQQHREQQVEQREIREYSPIPKEEVVDLEKEER